MSDDLALQARMRRGPGRVAAQQVCAAVTLPEGPGAVVRSC